MTDGDFTTGSFREDRGGDDEFDASVRESIAEHHARHGEPMVRDTTTSSYPDRDERSADADFDRAIRESASDYHEREEMAAVRDLVATQPGARAALRQRVTEAYGERWGAADPTSAALVAAVASGQPVSQAAYEHAVQAWQLHSELAAKAVEIEEFKVAHRVTATVAKQMAPFIERGFSLADAHAAATARGSRTGRMAKEVLSKPKARHDVPRSRDADLEDDIRAAALEVRGRR